MLSRSISSIARSSSLPILADYVILTSSRGISSSKIRSNNENNKSSANIDNIDNNDIGTVARKIAYNKNSEDNVYFYEGPFANVALRLKRVSLTTCAIGLIGLPAAIMAQNLDLASLSSDASVLVDSVEQVNAGGVAETESSISLGGQLAVAGTAGVAAVGSTLLLSFFFNPYVHTMEYVPACDSDNDDKLSLHVRATTRTLLSTKLETVFDPSTIIAPSNSRPFCNFIADGVPMYVHPELIDDPRFLKILDKSKQKSHM